MSRHELFNPTELAPPSGFSYAAVAAPGRTVHLAGITGHGPDGSIAIGLVAQFARACRTVAEVIEASGGSPTDLVSMTIFTTEIATYRASRSELGEEYRAVFGKHYPPMALFGIAELYDPRAVVELVCVAVVPTDVQ